LRNLLPLLLLGAGLQSAAGGVVSSAWAAQPATTTPAVQSLLDLRLTQSDGTPIDPNTLAQKVVLIVNVASFCRYTDQYMDLQYHWRERKKDGLVVIGVPSNQFAGQEPGTNAEIQNFCTSRYGVTFPILEKQDVNGPQRSALYQFLVNSSVGKGEDVIWNFEKFIVGRDGEVFGRFSPNTSPRNPSFETALNLALEASP